MLRHRLFGMFILLAGTILFAPSLATAAKKPKTDTPPAGYTKVASVDMDKKTFQLTLDDTVYKFTDDTTNKDKIAIGIFVKVTLKDGSKTDVTSVDAAPETTAKKKKKKAATE